MPGTGHKGQICVCSSITMSQSLPPAAAPEGHGPSQDPGATQEGLPSQPPPVASRQAEIVKRLSGICAQIIPFLTQEVSGPRGAEGRLEDGRAGSGGWPRASTGWRRGLGWRQVLAEGEVAEGPPGPESRLRLRGLGRVARPLCVSVVKFSRADPYGVVRTMLGAS